MVEKLSSLTPSLDDKKYLIAKHFIINSNQPIENRILFGKPPIFQMHTDAARWRYEYGIGIYN